MLIIGQKSGILGPSIYIIMWDVGLSFFLSVRLLVAYGNQNQTTHVKAKRNSEIPTLCRMF